MAVRGTCKVPIGGSSSAQTLFISRFLSINGVLLDLLIPQVVRSEVGLCEMGFSQ